jgi:hypothetical protein
VAGVQHLWVRRVTCDYFFVFVSLEWPRQLVSTKTPRHTPNGIPTHSGVAAWNEAAANVLAFYSDETAFAVRTQDQRKDKGCGAS